MKKFWLVTLSLMVPFAVPGHAQVVGPESGACAPGGGPAIRADIVGLKDRKGRLKLELYPPTAEDFLKDDSVLLSAGKVFRRVWADMPQTGPVSVCIRVPRPGRYALLFTHDRDGKNKFDYRVDGGGVPGNVRFGYGRPKYTTALVEVGEGTTVTTIKAQYFRGLLSGFGPLPVRN